MSRGIDNKDSGAFKSSSELVGKVHRTARDLERTIENLSVGNLMDDVAGVAVGSGIRGGATLQVANALGGGAQKREEERRKFTRAMHRALRELEQLNADIARLDDEIDGILAKHLSKSELDRLKKITDERQRHLEEMRIMREKLAKGEITRAEFDRFEDRWNKRQNKMDRRDEVEQAIQEADPEMAAQIARNVRMDHGEAAAAKTTGEKRANVESAVEEVADDGNKLRRDTASDEAFFTQDETSPFGTSAETSVLGGPLTSVASAALPNDNPLLAKAPQQVSEEFNEKANTVAPVEPDADIATALDAAITPQADQTPKMG